MDAQAAGRPSQVFRVDAGQKLAVSLPAKSANPQGELRGIAGDIKLDHAHLHGIKGQISFDLRQLVMTPEDPIRSQAKKSPPPDSNEIPPVRDWTPIAQQWLGLTGPDRAAAQWAHFAIEGARELSSDRAWQGRTSKTRGSAEEEVVEVRGIVEGRLSVRNLSTHRRFPVKLLFFYKGKASSQQPPRAVEVELQAGVSVPLAEHEIVPRDAQGHKNSADVALLGLRVGRTARLSGILRLTARQAPMTAK